MTTHHLNLLAELPLPVAPGKRRFESAVDCIAQSAGHPPLQDRGAGPPSLKETHQATYPLLTAERLGLTAHEWERYTQEQGLVHLHHDIWHEAHQPITRAIRAESLAMVAPADYLYRIRFSRLSAAWILGYVPQLPAGRIDIDYSRDNRCNLPRSYRALFAAHQTTIIPYDSISIGAIQLTTPLRTAIDLVSYHDEVEHLKAVSAILRDPHNTVSPQLFLKALADKPNLRKSSYLRAEHLVQECLREQANSAASPATAGQTPPRVTRPAISPLKNQLPRR